jgi:hypothetical protein
VGALRICIIIMRKTSIRSFVSQHLAEPKYSKINQYIFDQILKKVLIEKKELLKIMKILKTINLYSINKII